MISVSFFVLNKERVFPTDKSWEQSKNIYGRHVIMCFFYFSFKNALCVSMGKPFGNHKTCLNMGFSEGNTIQCQQCKEILNIKLS